MLKSITTYLILIVSVVFAQEQNITSSLKLIESGNIDEARSNLVKLKNAYPDDPSVKFLEAVLTENGENANAIYEDIYVNNPNSNYADASLYRIFSYYYAKGIYGRAEELKELLKSKYPSSPYLRAVDRTIPDDDDVVSETPAESPAIESVHKNNYLFSIQAGAFLNNSNARRLAETLQEDGYTAIVAPKEIGGSIFNIVTVGRFASRDEAEKFLSVLKKDYKLEGRIIPLN